MGALALLLVDAASGAELADMLHRRHRRGAALRPVIEARKMREGERPRAYHISLLTPLFSGRLDGSSHAPRALPPCLGSSIHASSDLTPPTADHGNTGIMHKQ